MGLFAKVLWILRSNHLRDKLFCFVPFVLLTNFFAAGPWIRTCGSSFQVPLNHVSESAIKPNAPFETSAVNIFLGIMVVVKFTFGLDQNK